MLHNIKTEKANSAEQQGYSQSQKEAMQRTVLNIFVKWQLTDRQAAILLGDISTKTVQRWRSGAYGKIDRDLADRLSHILGIHKALRIIYLDAGQGYDWVKAANTVFDGHSALDVMMKGGMTDLMRVRRYLDNVRGGW